MKSLWNAHLSAYIAGLTKPFSPEEVPPIMESLIRTKTLSALIAKWQKHTKHIIKQDQSSNLNGDIKLMQFSLRTLWECYNTPA